MLRGLLAAEGCKIGRRHVKTLMRRMGIEALYRRPRTTKPEPGCACNPILEDELGLLDDGAATTWLIRVVVREIKALGPTCVILQKTVL